MSKKSLYAYAHSNYGRFDQNIDGNGVFLRRKKHFEECLAHVDLDGQPVLAFKKFANVENDGG